jgi:hypothetical protein
MAVRRRYKQPRHYREGGRVLADTPIPGDQVHGAMSVPVTSVADDPAPAAADLPVQAQDRSAADPGADAVLNAVMGQRRAEELQREHHRRQMEDANHAALNAEKLDREAQQLAAPKPPARNERREAFAREHPELNHPDNDAAVKSYFAQGIRMGMDPHGAELDNYVLRGLRFEQQARAARLAPQEPELETAAVAPPQARPEAPMPASNQMTPREPMTGPPAARRSMPMAAPVSREAPNVSSGTRRSNDMTLTPEERAIARASIIDRPDMPRMTDAQKEHIYWQNRERMRELKRQGVITDGGRG